MIDTISHQDAEREYHENTNVCPFCAGQVIAGEMMGDGDCQHLSTSCSQCGAEFIETYKLDQVELVHGPGEYSGRCKALRA